METIDLLYRKSTFHIHGGDQLCRLPRLMLPQRLNAIVSLEFVWYRLHLPLSVMTAEDWNAISEAVQSIPKSFPCLQTLFLSFRAISYSSHYSLEGHKAYEKGFYGPLDSMVRACSKTLKHCTIAICARLQNHMMAQAVKNGAVKDVVNVDPRVQYSRFWRRVEQVDWTHTPLGYWIREG